MTDLRADVVIVGSGVAGALIAAKLAQQGVKVIVLEAGPRIDRVEAVERFFSAPVKVPECAYPQGPEIPHPVTNKLDGWFRQTGPDFFKST
jgi:choline dehydrogenase-like flavoprotein